MTYKRYLKLVAICSLMLCALSCNAKDLDRAQSDPIVIANLVVENLLNRKDYMMYISDHYNGIHYAEAAAGYGALKFANASKNKKLIAELNKRYRVVPGTDKLLEAGHVDANVWGILPLQQYLNHRVSSSESFKDKFNEGKTLADAQWIKPNPDGMSNQTRYWIDDIWMVNALQVQAFRATGDQQYLDRAALQTAAYLKKLQQENGLFNHGENAPFHWGRGNGWVAAGLAELLSELPTTNLYYPQIKQSYVRMMNALLAHQAEDGMWRQLIDHPESWKETSATAMFGYAIRVGVLMNILKAEEFQTSYQKAWSALTTYVDDKGALSDICIGTGQSLDIQYYLDRPRHTGDLHGQAPLLWFANSLITND